MAKKKNMTTKEYLICIDTKLKNLKEQFDNHLKHHWAITIALITIIGTGVIKIIIELICKIVK